MLDNIILEKYLQIAVETFPSCIMKPGHYNFRCNVCGDSAKSKSMKRGHLKLRNSDDGESFWYYRCFNGECECSDRPYWSGKRWLKTFFPDLYESYRSERFATGSLNSAEYIRDLEAKAIEFQKKREAKEKARKEKREAYNVKFFKPITSDLGIKFEAAREECIRRQIPEDIWKRFYYAVGGDYEDRIIIPFFDKNDAIYYFQARAMFACNNKYINRTSNKDNAIYNIHHIDKNKPVIVVEGPIDSMFIDNAVATLGLSVSQSMEDLMRQMSCYYIFDDDQAGVDTARKYIDNGKHVFLWKKFKQAYGIQDQYDEDGYKKKSDINDVYILLNRKTAFTFDELSQFFSKNMFDKFHLRDI